MTRPAALALACLLLLLGTSGCGRIREISACRGLAREVNPVIDELTALANAKGGPDELRIAARYGELAKRVKARANGKDALANAIRDYASILEATDAAVRAHEEAKRWNRGPRIGETRRELDRVVKRERAAVTRIETECQS